MKKVVRSLHVFKNGKFYNIDLNVMFSPYYILSEDEDMANKWLKNTIEGLIEVVKESDRRGCHLNVGARTVRRKREIIKEFRDVLKS